MMKSPFVVLCASLLLTACLEVPVEVGRENRTVKLVGYNPPKHFYVDLVDVNNGQKFTRVFVSKHCNKRHGRLKVGEVFEMPVIIKETKKNGGVTRGYYASREFLKKKYCG